MLIVGAALFARALTLRESVLPGVSVAGVDVGGLSRTEAQAVLQTAACGAPRRARSDLRSARTRASPFVPTGIWALDARATEERAYQAGRDSLLSRLGALAAPFAFEHEVEPVLDVRPAERRANRDRAARADRPAGERAASR